MKKREYVYKTVYNEMVKRGMKLSDMAQYLHISSSQVSYLLKGSRTLSIDVMMKIAELLEIGLDDLFGKDYVIWERNHI